MILELESWEWKTNWSHLATRVWRSHLATRVWRSHLATRVWRSHLATRVWMSHLATRVWMTPLILYTLPLCRRVSGFSARGHARTTGGTRQEAHCHASSHATQHFLDACAGGGGFGEVGGARRHKSGAPPLFCLPCARNLSTRGPGLGGDARLQRVRLRHLSPSSSFVCVTFFRLRHLWCAWCAWCVCVKL